MLAAKDKTSAETDVATRATRPGQRLRYFVPLKNEPGEQMRLDKRLLTIDPAYQRKVNMTKVRGMAENWSWLGCGVLVVSKRPGSKFYFVVDGQHRFEAAKLRDDIVDLPCICFSLDTVADEAVGFLSANTERRIPTLADQFKALLMVGDPVAKVANELAVQAGRKMGAPADKDHISCVGGLMRAIRDDEQAIQRVWPLIVDLGKDRPMPVRLIMGVHALERRMPPDHSLSDDRWAERLRRIGGEAVLQSIAVVAGIEGNSAERTCAAGVLRALNRGLRNPVHIDLDSLRR